MRGINVDQDFLRKLEESNIFQVRTQMRDGATYIQRFEVGDKIQCDINTCIEEYSSFGSGYNFFSSGAFSSLASALPTNSVIGRYTSFAAGYKSLGYRHPIEAVCMNAISYDFQREHLLAYLRKYESKHGKLMRHPVPTPQPQWAPIILGHDVWVGNNVTIAGGVKIGNGAVIAGGSVVTTDVAAYSIVAGVPAQHKKFRFPQEIIDGLEEARWWEYELGDLYKEGLDFASPIKFLNKFHVVKRNLSLFNIRKFFPYLHRYGLELSPINLIADYHGRLLFYNPQTKQLIQSSQYRPDLIPVKLQRYKQLWYLVAGDMGLINLDQNMNVTLVDGLQYIDYELTLKDDNSFFVKLNARYLCSHIEKFIWQPHLLEWEHFYSFLDLSLEL